MHLMRIRFHGPIGQVPCFFAGMFLLASFTTSADAGFLEELFGAADAEEASNAPRARVRPASRRSFSLRFNNSSRAAKPKQDERRGPHAAERQTAEDRAAAQESKLTEAKPVKPIFCAAEPVQSPPENISLLLLRDATLRPGDGIVTPDGILIFRGRASCPHSESDFVALAHSRLPRQKRNVLLSLENTLRSPQPKQDARMEKSSETRVAGEGRP